MAGSARSKGLALGVAALTLGASALWSLARSERMPGREGVAVDRRVRTEPRGDPGSSVSTVQRERSKTLDEPAGVRVDALRVDVVDSGGRPAAGISLVCGTVSPGASATLEALARARTDARGSAWLELGAARASASATGEPLHLRAEILADPAPGIVLEAGDPRDHVVLRLPPTGSLRLEVTDALGRAVPTAVQFGLWGRAVGAASDVSLLPRWLAAPQGVADLEHVGLGLELRVLASADGDEARAERVVASGPCSAGQRLTVSVPLGAPWPTVGLRALDADGQILRNEVLDTVVTWSRPRASPSWSSDASVPRRIRTDDEGRASFPLRGRVAGGYTRRLVLTHREGPAGDLRSAERDLSWDGAAGAEIDLGDVQLRALEPERAREIWVSGSVVDPAGRPVRNATVLVSAIDPEGTPLRGQAAHARVEPEGTFAVAGPPVEARLSARASAPGFRAGSEQVVAPGASDVRLRLQPAACWEGRLLLDPGIPPESLVVDVLAGGRRQRTIPSSERIAVDGLAEALIDVEVRVRAGDWLVERWEGLPTSTGMPADARVAPLDLRGRLVLLRLQLAELDGKPLDLVHARIRPEPWPAGGDWIRAGRLDAVVPAGTRSITVEPRGYRPVAAELVEGIQELRCSR